MLTGPPSGCHVHTAVWVSEDDRACATRLARYCARKPVALDRLPVDRTAKAVTNRLDTSDGPTAGTETVDPLEFLARVMGHIPDTGHVTTRYDGWYANRPRGMRRQAEPAEAETPSAIVPALRLAPTEATRRWAAVLQQLVEIDPLACPRCHGALRLVACRTPRSVIDQILAHRRALVAREPHAGPRSPIDAGPDEPRRVTRPTPARSRHDRPLVTPPPRCPRRPRHHAGTCGVRGRSSGASDRSLGRPSAHGTQRPDIHRGAAADVNVLTRALDDPSP